MRSYRTLEDHESLLADRGYLSESFMTAYKIGYWLRQFREQYDQSLYQALDTKKPQRFPMTAYGQFNEALEKVKFAFHYEYNPRTDALSLKSFYAKMGISYKPYLLHRSSDLPAATEVFETLRLFATLNKQYDLYRTLEKQFRHDRERLNDYVQEDREGNPRPYKAPARQMRIKH